MVYVLKRMRVKDALWELSDAERKEMLAARKKMMEAAGRKLVTGHYKSFTGDHIFILSYPNLEAVQKVREELMSHGGFGHSKYFEVEEEILYEVVDP